MCCLQNKTLVLLLFPTLLHAHQRMNANGTSTKWFIFLKQEYNELHSCNGYVTLLLFNAQWQLLCALSFLEAVMELSSLSSVILLRLLSSTVWIQLTLDIPLWGPGAPHPQNGVSSPGIPAYSLSRVRNSYSHLFIICSLTKDFFGSLLLVFWN
jgi:hypothetical protein